MLWLILLLCHIIVPLPTTLDLPGDDRVLPQGHVQLGLAALQLHRDSGAAGEGARLLLEYTDVTLAPGEDSPAPHSAATPPAAVTPHGALDSGVPGQGVELQDVELPLEVAAQLLPGLVVEGHMQEEDGQALEGNEQIRLDYIRLD